MQDKSLDAMAKKYKEEMMRLYAKHPEGTNAVQTAAPAAQEVTAKPCEETVSGTSQQPREQTETQDVERLMHPPMPTIPNVSPKSEEKVVENAQKSKFPTPEELMASAEPQSEAAETAQSEAAPRFDSTNDGHEQGNYEFTEAERNVFPDGEGYLKLEVTGGGQPLDCALAAVFRVTDGGDVLTATFFTDSKGETEVITLPVPSLDERYTVTVAKEGFFAVRDLEVPIFDSIKSIQPVELKCE